MTVMILRTALMYVAIILAVRLMGKRQIGEMQAGELVVTILISELAAIPLQDLSQPILGGLLSIFTLVVLELSVSALCLVSLRLRGVMSGKSVTVIADGKIDQKALRKLRMTVDDLMEALRLKDVFCVSDVQYAIVETNGQLSVLLTPQSRPAEAGQLGKPEEDRGLERVIVSDGKLLRQVLQGNGIGEDRIRKELKKRHLSVRQVFLMTVDAKGEFTVVKKEKKA